MGLLDNVTERIESAGVSAAEAGSNIPVYGGLYKGALRSREVAQSQDDPMSLGAIDERVSAGLSDPGWMDSGQGAAQFLTRSDDADEAAAKINAGWTAPRKAADSAVEGTAADNWVTDGMMDVPGWLIGEPVRGVTQLAGVDPAQDEAIDEADAKLTGIAVFDLAGGKMISGAFKGGKALLKGGSKAADDVTKVDDIALPGNKHSIENASRHVGTKADEARHSENLSGYSLENSGLPALRAGGDETSVAWRKSVQQTTSAVDDTLAGADNFSASIRNVVGANARTLSSGARWAAGSSAAKWTGILSGAGLATIGTAAGLNAMGALPDMGPGISTEVAREYDQGQLLLQFLKGESSMGYAVFVEQDPQTGMIGSLTRDGDVRWLTESQFTANFDSEDAANDAHAEFVRKYVDGTAGEGPMGLSELQESEHLTGGVDAPSRIGVAEAFDISFSLVSDVEADSNVTVALATNSGLVPLTTHSLTFGAGEEVSGTLSIPSGAAQVEPGYAYPLVLFATEGAVEGVAASTEVAVVESGDHSSAWETPEVAQEMDGGWYLFSQQNASTGETRFTVAGGREDGSLVYLHADGRGRSEPYIYDDPEGAAAAYETWAARVENGTTSQAEMPSEAASRPDPGAVGADLDREASTGLLGLAGTISGALTSGPGLAALSALALTLLALVILK